VTAKDNNPFKLLAALAVGRCPQSSSSVPISATVTGNSPGTRPTAAGNSGSFAFKEQFDFTKAEQSTSLPGISVSSGSSAFPPPLTRTSSGIIRLPFRTKKTPALEYDNSHDFQKALNRLLG